MKDIVGRRSIIGGERFGRRREDIFVVSIIKDVIIVGKILGSWRRKLERGRRRRRRKRDKVSCGGGRRGVRVHVWIVFNEFHGVTRTPLKKREAVVHEGLVLGDGKGFNGVDGDGVNG